ncbi:MAG: PEGA domain-containing protein [Deltaproteobacteria bacterium]|jgi:hypothetical protein|nr:PEGA domain-containing protein [Deltaproteobacteria bacterium]
MVRWLVFALSTTLMLGAPMFAERPAIAKDAPKVSTGIEWKVTPSAVVVYLDGKKLGEAGNLTVTETKPGKHEIKLVNGGDETEIEIKVNKGQVLQFSYDFEE